MNEIVLSYYNHQLKTSGGKLTQSFFQSWKTRLRYIPKYFDINENIKILKWRFRKKLNFYQII